jgi:gp16 family phage-associated protein
MNSLLTKPHYKLHLDGRMERKGRCPDELSASKSTASQQTESHDMSTSHIAQRIDAFRAELDAAGESVAEFCRRNNLDYNTMQLVLRGRSQGKRGKVHKVFVALGIKSGKSFSLVAG